MSIIPILKSEASLGRSILTLNAPEEIKDNKPVSIFSIAKHHGLEKVFVADSKFYSFLSAYKESKKCGIPLFFGYEVYCCADIDDKTDTSKKTEHKIIIWLKNSNGYENLVKIGTKAQTEGFYGRARIDCNSLTSLWSDDLLLTIPFYDSFLHNNTLKFGYNCIPDFPVNPILFIEDNDHPHDQFIKCAINNFNIHNNWEMQETQTCRYYRYSDIEAYMTFRAINHRSTLAKPNLSDFCNSSQCFENYLNKIGKGI